MKKEEEVQSLQEEQSEKIEQEVSTEENNETKEEKKGLFKKKDNAEKNKLQEALKKEEEKSAQLQDKVLRVTAEMQNMRRRMEEERAALLKYEGENIVKDVLPVIDTFERAISIDESKLSDDVKKFLEGFKLIYGNLNNIFKKYEIEEMDILNKPFDPNSMEAVLLEEVEGMEANMVVEVLQKGYTYKGKVIRHAMVKVSK